MTKILHVAHPAGDSGDGSDVGDFYQECSFISICVNNCNKLLLANLLKPKV